MGHTEDPITSPTTPPNTGDTDIWLDELVFLHEGHSPDAWCCLRDESVRAAITKKQTELIIAELKNLDEHTTALEEFAYHMHGIIENRISELRAEKTS